MGEASDLGASPEVPGGEKDVAPEREKRLLVEKLFKDHRLDLINWLRRRYGDGPPEPEEVAQNAFAAMSGLKRVDQIRYPKTFLFTVAVHSMLKSKRWYAQARRAIELDFELFSETLEELTPERLYLAGESLEQLREAVKHLSPKQREILLRSRIQGQTYREICAQTGWSEADISRQLKHVLTQLRALRPGREGFRDEDVDEQ